MATQQNFVHVTNSELEGVATSTFTVDFINSMAAETGSLATNSSTAGLEATRAVIGNFCNILSEGPLFESNKQKTYTVRTDTLGTLISANTLRDGIRALHGAGNCAATVSGATVTAKDVEIET